MSKIISERGKWRIGRAPDCHAIHACILGSNPAHPAWVIQRNILISPLSMWPGDHVNGGQVELKQFYRRYNFFSNSAPHISMAIYISMSISRLSLFLCEYVQEGLEIDYITQRLGTTQGLYMHAFVLHRSDGQIRRWLNMLNSYSHTHYFLQQIIFSFSV